GTDDDGDPRGCRAGHARRLGVGPAHGLERWLGAPLAIGHAEVPVLDLVTTAVPFVGPREDEGARATAGEGAMELPAQRLRLPVLAVGAAVQADLREHERALVGQVLQPREVGLE